MTGNLKFLVNFVEKFLGTVKFGNDQIAPILSYGDLVQGAVMIKRVYYVEGLNHNLFSVGQFSDADFEVAFWKSTCYIRDLKGNDIFTGDLSTHTTKYTFPALTQKVFANMRRVEKEFFGVETPLFEEMLVGQDIEDEGDHNEHVEDVTAGDDAQGDDTAAHEEVPTISQEPSIPSPTLPIPPPQPPQDLPSTS
nr:integrase, catalytic region, zinc finger, CCHC-type, peptidase aspartic, catalytic [Tanacetum cinerariifolium]